MQRPAGERQGELPPAFIAVVVAACLLLSSAHWLGLDLGLRPPPSSGAAVGLLRGDALADAWLSAAHGAMVHLLLDWSAVLLALVTGALALLRHGLRRDAVTIVLGLAMLGAGFVDAFHALTASHLLMPAAVMTPAMNSVADPVADPVALSWIVSRAWQALALILGAGIFVVWPGRAQQLSGRALAVAAVVLGGGAWVLVNVLSALPVLPALVHPGALIPRPWDLLPIGLFLVAAGSVLPRLHRQVPSVFTHALLISTIPLVVGELHMTLGAHRPLDHHNVVAHLMRLLGYGVIAAGLVVDYLEQHRAVRRQAADLAAGVAIVGLLNQRLRRTVDDLQQFANAASHDLKAPLLAVAAICGWLDEDIAAGALDDVPKHLKLMRSRVARAERLLDDLRAYAALSRSDSTLRSVDTGALVDDVVAVLGPPQGFSITRSGDFPTLVTQAGRLEQVFLNLLGNALKHHDRSTGKVWVRTHLDGPMVIFEVADDGPGIAAEHRKRVFAVFSTLKARDVVEGSGMGLAIVKKTVAVAGGRIELEDNTPRGCVFRFSWPRVWEGDAGPRLGLSPGATAQEPM